MEFPHPKPKKQMPHVKRRCHRCAGSGRAPCQICGGAGRVLRRVDAQGHQEFGQCEGCFGVKSRRCGHCGGDGFA